MMPQRDRLATDLFEPATLRSPLGISVLRGMMALLNQNLEVEFRLGLEREKCLCSKVKKDSEDSTTEKYD
jgi:hypothetical protein